MFVFHSLYFKMRGIWNYFNDAIGKREERQEKKKGGEGGGKGGKGG